MKDCRLFHWLTNVDDFHTNCQEMTTRTRRIRIRQNNLINNTGLQNKTF
jgi:hypothetical protein